MAFGVVHRRVQVADLVELVRPSVTVPVHYDDYDVFRSPLSHFQHEMRARGLEKGLHAVLRGETIPLDESRRR
jgi:L-ascorbate metabolism protein UlaG (beta-lactamase superfamily)